MVFSTMLFLWVFLPVVLIGNFLIGILPFGRPVKIRLKNIFLLLASLFFYGWGGPRYLLLMIGVILVNYASGLFIGIDEDHKRFFLFIGILSNLLILGYFKYFNLLIHTIESISGGEYGSLGFKEVILPIGISFYIFQAISYVIDVYRGNARVQKNIPDFALYVSLFPQLIAGPIVQYRDIEKQLVSRKENAELFSSGVTRFVYGLSKKVLLANTFGEAVDKIWKLDISRMGSGVAVFGAVLYSLQIYYDFSGYSDMAIGLGRMLGFEFRENFNLPYTAVSVRDFWRRWHISLSSWFRDYVYIPLGGSRKGIARVCVNVFIVFLLTGIWHGANYTFFFWGMYYAVFLIIERLISYFSEKKSAAVKDAGEAKDAEKDAEEVGNGNPRGAGVKRFFGHIYALIVVIVGWVFFRADSISDAFGFIGAFFRPNAKTYSVLNYMSFKMCVALVLGVLFAGPLQAVFGKFCDKNKDKAFFAMCGILVRTALAALCILLLAGGTYNPFIYFQF